MEIDGQGTVHLRRRAFRLTRVELAADPEGLLLDFTLVGAPPLLARLSGRQARALWKELGKLLAVDREQIREAIRYLTSPGDQDWDKGMRILFRRA